MKKIKNALLVDDDETVNFLNKRLFDRMGVAERLSQALNGREALERIVRDCAQSDTGEDCPDLILLDVNMPVMNGFEFLREYLKLGLEGTPVVYLLTSSTDPRDLRQADGLRVAGVLEKPLDQEALARVIERHF